MPRRLLLGSLALLATLGAATAPASAGTALSPPTQPFQGWIDSSYVPTPPRTLNFYFPSNSACPQAVACTDYYSIWMLDTGTGERATLLHEVGHNFDYWRMDSTDRHNLAVAMPGRDQDPADWYLQENPADGNASTNVEWFADSYSVCARVAGADLPGHWYTTGDGLTSGDRLRSQVCPAVRAAY